MRNCAGEGRSAAALLSGASTLLGDEATLLDSYSSQSSFLVSWSRPAQQGSSSTPLELPSPPRSPQQSPASLENAVGQSLSFPKQQLPARTRLSSRPWHAGPTRPSRLHALILQTPRATAPSIPQYLGSHLRLSAGFPSFWGCPTVLRSPPPSAKAARAGTPSPLPSALSRQSLASRQRRVDSLNPRARPSSSASSPSSSRVSPFSSPLLLPNAAL